MPEIQYLISVAEAKGNEKLKENIIRDLTAIKNGEQYGAYTPRTERIYIAPGLSDNQQANLAQILSHEVLTHGVLQHYGADSKLVRQIEADSDLSKIFHENDDAIEATYEGASEDTLAKERLAYFVQNYVRTGADLSSLSVGERISLGRKIKNFLSSKRIEGFSKATNLIADAMESLLAGEKIAKPKEGELVYAAKTGRYKYGKGALSDLPKEHRARIEHELELHFGGKDGSVTDYVAAVDETVYVLDAMREDGRISGRTIYGNEFENADFADRIKEELEYERSRQGGLYFENVAKIGSPSNRENQFMRQGALEESLQSSEGQSEHNEGGVSEGDGDGGYGLDDAYAAKKLSPEEKKAKKEKEEARRKEPATDKQVKRLERLISQYSLNPDRISEAVGFDVRTTEMTKAQIERVFKEIDKHINSESRFKKPKEEKADKQTVQNKPYIRQIKIPSALPCC